MVRKTKETKPETEQELSNQAIEVAEVSSVYAGDDDGVNHRSRCGGALRTARESQSLSIQDIASRLRLGPKQIEALETDNFTALPEPTIVRGFIRNYAKQLKINAEPLLDAYNVLVPNSDLHRLIVKPSANMKMTSHKKPKPGRYLLAVLVALLALGAWLFYQNYIEKPHPVALSEGEIGEATNGEVVASTEPLPEAALPAAEREVTLQTSTELTLPAAPTADATLSPADANVNTAPPATTALPVPLVPSATTALPTPLAPAEPAVLPPATPDSNGTAKLEFNASQETWVSIVDASGREIYNKIIFAGSRDSFNVTPPVSVTVGNAGATNLSMNGKPIELAPHMRGNVARLKLE